MFSLSIHLSLISESVLTDPFLCQLDSSVYACFMGPFVAGRCIDAAAPMLLYLLIRNKTQHRKTTCIHQRSYFP